MKESDAQGQKVGSPVNKLGKPLEFTFSTSQELGGTTCCKKFVIFSAILAYCAIFPLLYYFGPEYIPWWTRTDISYWAIMYIFVFNTLFLIGIGYCVVGCVAYPYSNSYFNNSQKK